MLWLGKQAFAQQMPTKDALCHGICVSPQNLEPTQPLHNLSSSNNTLGPAAVQAQPKDGRPLHTHTHTEVARAHTDGQPCCRL
eukprot:1162031-Pelagomonas_calceolata.AAC.4